MSRGPFDAHLITGNLANGDKASRTAAVFAHTDDDVDVVRNTCFDIILDVLRGSFFKSEVFCGWKISKAQIPFWLQSVLLRKTNFV